MSGQTAEASEPGLDMRAGNELFEPDILLPAQYARGHGGDPYAPLRRLARAVIEDAMSVFVPTVARERNTARARAEARAWVLDLDGDYPVTFRTACTLALPSAEPEAVGAALLRAWDRAEQGRAA